MFHRAKPEAREQCCESESFEISPSFDANSYYPMNPQSVRHEAWNFLDMKKASRQRFPAGFSVMKRFGILRYAVG